MIKIVYCIPETFKTGGMERVLANKTRYLAQSSTYEIHIVTTEQKGRDPFFPFHPAITHHDLQINYWDSNNKPLIFRIISFIRKKRLHKKRLEYLLKELRADIVVSMFGYEALFLCNLQDNSKKVLEIHFSKYFRYQIKRRGFWKWINRYRIRQDEKVVRKFDRFVVLTEEDKAQWKSCDNLLVIPNASLLNPAQRSSLKKRQVIAAGRLCYEKGFERLIEAWNIVHENYPEWQLFLFGEGEAKEKLLQQIARLQLNDSIKIKAPVLEIEKEYLHSSLLVMSSRSEGFPMVLLEAMACGLPVVAFNCKCGPKDIITDSIDGLLIEEGNISALAEGIMKVIRDEKLRKQMGEAAYLKSQHFSEETVMKKWQELFHSLLYH